jgi:hypothetical protein
MNKKEKEFRKIRALQQIPYSDRVSKRNCVKIWGSDKKINSYEHERVKFDICYKLISQGYQTWTEVNVDNMRMDVVAISPDGTLYCIEVLNSEEDKRYEEKLNKYNINFEMVKVRCKDFKIDRWEL